MKTSRSTMRCARALFLAGGALLLAGGALLTVGACGGADGSAARNAQSAIPSFKAPGSADAIVGCGATETNAAETGDGSVAGVCRAVEEYLAARDRVLLPAAHIDDLARNLHPGSPADRQERLVARGRTTLAARAGLSYATARTEANVAAGAVSLYDGTTPLPASTADGRALTANGRAIVVVASVARFTLSDRSEQTVRQDHVIVLSPDGNGWSVFSDAYAEPALAAWLRAGGATSAQVRAAQVWAAQAVRVRHQSATPESAVGAFVAALDARRYAVADLYLDPAFGGTAQGMGMWLKSVRLKQAQPAGAATPTEARLMVTLQVRARASSWNDGANVRFVSLCRRAADEPWRISAIDSGP